MTKTIRNTNEAHDTHSNNNNHAPVTETVLTDPAPAAVDLTVSTDPRQQAAYEVILPEAMAMTRQQLIAVNIDPSMVVMTCFAVCDQVRPHRATMAAMPGFDITTFDKLETNALALEAAQGRYNVALSPPDSLGDLVDRGIALRRSFGLAAASLSDAGVINANRFESVPTGNGYREIASALSSYAIGFRIDHWEVAKAKSALTDEILAEAESLSTRILAKVGYRELAPERIAEAADIRQRIFSLCVQRYDQVRRAVTYILWNDGNADEVAPSLYAKGPRRPPTPAKSDAQQPATEAAPAGGHATATPAAAPATAPLHVTSAPAGAIGTPNSSPFTAT